jgi:polynucleotide 5'-hydroxyl-kinase GRC3/NOL9
VVQIQATNCKKNLPPGVFWSCPADATPDLIQLAAAGAGAQQAAAAAPQDVGGDAQQPQQQPPPARQQRPPTAVEGRALQWLAWAQRVVAASGAGPAGCSSSGSASWDSAEAFSSAAAALAAVPPFEVPLSEVAVECPHCPTATPEQLPYLLNGSLVALLGKGQAGEAGGAARQALRPCLGVGLVRAVDARRGLLYLLTDLSEEALGCVEALQLGRLELPHSLLQCAPLQSPYLALGCLAGGASGAGTIKARNNLQRVSLLAG